MRNKTLHFIRSYILIFLFFSRPIFSSGPIGLPELEDRLSTELDWINYPPRNWHCRCADDQPYDVDGLP